MSSLMCLPGWR